MGWGDFRNGFFRVVSTRRVRLRPVASRRDPSRPVPARLGRPRPVATRFGSCREEIGPTPLYGIGLTATALKKV